MVLSKKWFSSELLDDLPSQASFGTRPGKARANTSLHATVCRVLCGSKVGSLVCVLQRTSVAKLRMTYLKELQDFWDLCREGDFV